MPYEIRLGTHVPADMARTIGEIDEFKGRWESLKSIAPDRLTVLRKVATIASIGSSTRIEGSRLSDAEVEALLGNINRQSFRNRDEQEVAGYADAMDLVFDSFADIPITENHIKQIHGLLLRRSDKDQRHKGEYKKLPNNVEAFDAEGISIGTIFETASPFETPLAMQDLSAWYQRESAEGVHHPLLLVGAFAVHFLAIHPFQDGNGRLSRILTSLMLLRQGYDYVPYCSLESIIEKNKDQYYLALRRAQASFRTDHAGMEEWLRYFLRILKKQKDMLRDRLEREQTLSLAELPNLDKEILTQVRLAGRLTISDIVTHTKANRNTIKKHLGALVGRGLLKRLGEGKGTTYAAG